MPSTLRYNLKGFDKLDKERSKLVSTTANSSLPAYPNNLEQVLSLDTERKETIDSQSNSLPVFPDNLEQFTALDQEKAESIRPQSPALETTEAINQSLENQQGYNQPPLFALNNTFSGGEIAPTLFARYNLPRYQTGCFKCRNAVILPQGGVTRRPGTIYQDMVHSDNSRLIPFVFSKEQVRILEFTTNGSCFVWIPDKNNRMRPARTAGGDYSFAIPYTASHIHQVDYAQSADVVYLAHNQYPPAKISRYDDNDWRYEVLDFMPPIDPPVIKELKVIGSIPNNETQRVTYHYVATAIDSETGLESNPSQIATIENIAPLSSTYYVEVSVYPVKGASEYRIYRKHGGVFGFIGRLSAESQK